MKEPRGFERIWHLYRQGGWAPALASVFDARTAQQMAFIRSVMRESRRNDWFDRRLDELEVVVFDLETTGFFPHAGDEIISIGAVLVHGERIGDEKFYTLVNPRRDVPENIQQLTGITDEMVRAAPELLDALHDFLRFVRHRVLVAHGSGHDKRFLNSALWRTSKINLAHRLLDCIMLAKWLFPDRGRYDLDTLLADFGIEITRRHHALEDAVMTAHLWIKLVREAFRRGVPTLGDLYLQLGRRLA